MMPESHCQLSVSVVIPAHNAAATISRTLDSLCEQTGLPSPLDVVVVDDGSDDGTADLVCERAERHCLTLIRQQRSGRSTARNVGALHACGKWLAFLDADDSVAPHWLQCLATDGLRRAGDRTMFIRCGAIVHDLNRQRTYLDVPRSRESPFDPTVTPFWPGTFLIRADAFKSIRGYDAALGFGENAELFIRLNSLLREAGGDALELDAVLVNIVRYVSTVDKYGALRGMAARRILAKHPSFFNRRPRTYADYLAVIAFEEARAGNFRGAFTHQLHGFRLWPSPKAAARSARFGIHAICRGLAGLR